MLPELQTGVVSSYMWQAKGHLRILRYFMQLVRSKLQSIQVSVMHKSAASPTLPGKKTPDTGFGATWEAILGKPFL